MKKIKPYHLAPILCLVIFTLTALSGLIDLSGTYSASNFLAMLVIQTLVFALPSLAYSRMRGQKHYKTLGLRPFGVNSFVLILLAALFLFLGSSLILLLTLKGSGGEYVSAIDMDTLTFPSTVYVIITYCVLPAVLEEFAFRGVVFNEYRPYGLLCAVVMSSALFAMLHFSVTNFLVYFFSGVALALVAAVTRSLFACMIVHFLNNLLVLFVQPILWQAASESDHLILFIFVTVSAALLLLFLALGRAESLLSAQSGTIPEEENVKYPPAAEKARVFFVSLVSPGFLACVAFFAVAAVVSLRA